MRQLKFRVWNGKRMGYPEVIELGICEVNGLPSASYPLIGGGYCTSSHVMQFTGLLDKNSVEIYEGDIVKIWNPAYEHYGNVIVEYDAPEYKLRWVPSVNCPLISIDKLHTFYDGEVIGNIYQKPESEVNYEV